MPARFEKARRQCLRPAPVAVRGRSRTRRPFEEMIHGPEDDHGIAAPEASMLLGQMVKSKHCSYAKWANATYGSNYCIRAKLSAPSNRTIVASPAGAFVALGDRLR